MIEKLELKDIAGYLPYDLMCLVDKWNESQLLTGIKSNGLYFFGEIGIADICLDKINPILRPMSDITKKIVIEGYNKCNPFTPLIKIAEACYPEFKGWRIDDEGRAYTRDNGYPHWISISDVELSTYEIFDMLNQWHFDYRGLIKKGLAVDINTIKR